MTDELKGWWPDPFGVHEFRFFSDDGKPTLLVRDGETKSYDKPPQTDSLHMLSRWAVPPEREFVAIETDQEIRQNPIVNDVGLNYGYSKNGSASVWQHESTSDVVNPEPRAVRPTTQNRPLRVAQWRQEAPDLPQQSAFTLTKSTKIAYGVVLTAMAVSAVALVILHFGSHNPPSTASSPPTSAGSTTTASTQASTTTLAIPPALKSSAAAAAAFLISSWAAGNQPEAQSVASAPAVAALFASHYTSGLVIDRGCSVAFQPIVCTYGPPGGANPNDPIYEIYVTPVSGGWYVSGVKVNN